MSSTSLKRFKKPYFQQTARMACQVAWASRSRMYLWKETNIKHVAHWQAFIQDFKDRWHELFSKGGVGLGLTVHDKYQLKHPLQYQDNTPVMKTLRIFERTHLWFNRPRLTQKCEGPQCTHFYNSSLIITLWVYDTSIWLQDKLITAEKLSEASTKMWRGPTASIIYDDNPYRFSREQDHTGLLLLLRKTRIEKLACVDWPG